MRSVPETTQLGYQLEADAVAVRRTTHWDGTSWGGARFLAMVGEIDSPVDQLREDGARAKYAVKAAIDPREKERLVRIAKKRSGKAIGIEKTCLERFVGTV